MDKMPDVSLTISQEIVKPIVTAKIQEAILAAMGGEEKLITTVVNQVLNQKVTENGIVSSYNNDNKYSWAEIVITRVIKDAVVAQMQTYLQECGPKIKAEIIKHLSSKKGVEKFAASLLENLPKIHSSYHSNVKIEFEQNKNNY